MLYYYDDDNLAPSKHLKKEFTFEQDALRWAEQVRRRRKPKSAILYTKSDTKDGLPFITIQEWKT